MHAFSIALEMRLLAMLEVGHGEPVLHGRRNAREYVGRGRRAAVQRKGGGRGMSNNGACAVKCDESIARKVADTGWQVMSQ